MKAVISLLILGLLFLHGEALQCYKGSCTGGPSCSLPVEICTGDQDQCVRRTKIRTNTGISANHRGDRAWTTPGCATKANCLELKPMKHHSRCCSGDLCNSPKEM
uniref:Amplexin 3 n=1 Tax=Rana temporaria TaxID=8407 RepID=U3N0A2_RANTE|nr:amplexin 3 [Rana temporaria]